MWVHPVGNLHDCVRKYMRQFIIVSLDFQCECNCNCNSVGLGRLLKNLKKNGGKHVLQMQYFVVSLMG